MSGLSPVAPRGEAAAPRIDGENRKSRMNRSFFFAKLAAGVGLLAILFHIGAANVDGLAAVFASPWRVAAAVFLVFLAMPLSGWRWRMLLEAQGVAISFRRSLGLTLVAGFFNVFLLGGVGGDGVRLLLASRSLDGAISRIAASAAVDRVIGLEALLIVAAASCLSRLPSSHGSPMLFNLSLVLMLTALAGLVAPLALMRLGSHPLAVRLLKRLTYMGRLGGIVANLSESLILYQRHPRALAAALGVSLVGHICVVVAFALFATPSGSPLTLWDYGFAVSTTQAVSVFAIVPGALGVAEAVFGYLTGLLTHGGMSLTSLFLGFRVVTALATAPGALLWLISPSRRLTNVSG